MSAALDIVVSLEQFVCGKCGGTYAIAAQVAQYKRDHAGYWHCPYCQTDWGYGKGALQKAKEELEAERQRHSQTLSRLNLSAAELAKTQKEAKRIRKRVQNGVCPCCNRTFVDLGRHMATKHPEHAK